MYPPTSFCTSAHYHFNTLAYQQINLRYFLDVAYNGTQYHGWQVQQNAHTVQAELEGALSKLLKTTIGIIGSGRTDTGVHAEQQLVHFDREEEMDVEQLHFRLNVLLPPDIAVKRIFPVHPKAHARFSALFRSYEYRISRQKNPFLQKLTYFNTRPLDVEAMNRAAELLLKWEDFECFSKVHTEVKHFRCNIKEAKWVEKDDMLVFHITANRFLRNMVRAIVGTLLDVGQHKMNAAEFQEVLESRDRSRAGRSAPAQGLFLTKVTYPDKIHDLSGYEESTDGPEAGNPFSEE